MALDFNDLEPIQQKAYNLATKPEKPIVRIVGYAGTGKTTVMAAVAAHLEGSCVVLAPTNKAAINLRMKGIEKAQTIHSLLYMPQEVEVPELDAEGQPMFYKNDDGTPMIDASTKQPIPIIKETKMVFGLRDVNELNLPSIALVDEASMVDTFTLEDLCSVFEYVVLFGDGFQLPPVGKGVKSALDVGEADVRFTEIHRVAEGNPIIQYATAIRNNNEPLIDDIKNGNEICYCSWGHKRLYESIVKNDVQAICYKNKTRHIVNERIRECMGYEANTLKDGEQIVCNANVRETVDDGYGGRERVLKFFNGQILTVIGDYEATDDHWTAVMVKLRDENGKEHYQRLWPFWNKGFFDVKDLWNDWNDEIQRRKASDSKRVLFGADMDYAYCLTAHKAQGSEFDNVAVFDERSTVRHSSFNEKQRWYYTAITRPKNRLLIVR